MRFERNVKHGTDFKEQELLEFKGPRSTLLARACKAHALLGGGLVSTPINWLGRLFKKRPANGRPLSRFPILATSRLWLCRSSVHRRVGSPAQRRGRLRSGRPLRLLLIRLLLRTHGFSR